MNYHGALLVVFLMVLQHSFFAMEQRIERYANAQGDLLIEQIKSFEEYQSTPRHTSYSAMLKNGNILECSWQIWQGSGKFVIAEKQQNAGQEHKEYNLSWEQANKLFNYLKELERNG